jgi:hypothetical protein
MLPFRRPTGAVSRWMKPGDKNGQARLSACQGFWGFRSGCVAPILSAAATSGNCSPGTLGCGPRVGVFTIKKNFGKSGLETPNFQQAVTERLRCERYRSGTHRNTALGYLP